MIKKGWEKKNKNKKKRKKKRDGGGATDCFFEKISPISGKSYFISVSRFGCL